MYNQIDVLATINRLPDIVGGCGAAHTLTPELFHGHGLKSSQSESYIFFVLNSTPSPSVSLSSHAHRIANLLHSPLYLSVTIDMTKTPIRRLLDKEMTRKEFLALGVLAVATVFGVTSLMRELQLRAATAATSIELEDGVLAGGAAKITDSSASGGIAVKFGSAGAGVAYDWSESNVPWQYGSTAEVTKDWPGATTIVDIQKGSADFYTNLSNTVNAASGRVVVRLGEGVYRLNQFRMIGTSGSPTYAFGFWFPKLQGFIGQGAEKTVIQMDANSMSSAQLSALATMTKASFAPNQMGLCRLDGTTASPVLLGALTFRAADQQMLTATAGDTGIVIPQPAPHQGIVLYPGSPAIVSHVRFQAAGRASMSQPPFEHANATSQYSPSLMYRNCEFDGRRSADLNPARPRRCAPIMFNNETSATMQDCWIHHSNVSRYAVNDENRDTSGSYVLTRVKAERISDTHNVDPALNGGNSLGGYTNASLFGWESCNGTVTVTDCIMSQDNSYTDNQIAQHLEFTSVGSRNPRGGRLVVRGGTYHNTAWPQLEGFLCIRAITNTYWVSDGYNTTMQVFSASGTRLAPYVYSGSWPPSAATLSAAGVKPATHFLVRN